MPAQWYLYECVECGAKTFLSPAGGALTECGCGDKYVGEDGFVDSSIPGALDRVLVTPLYEEGDGDIAPRTPYGRLVMLTESA